MDIKIAYNLNCKSYLQRYSKEAMTLNGTHNLLIKRITSAYWTEPQIPHTIALSVAGNQVGPEAEAEDPARSCHANRRHDRVTPCW